MLRSIELIAYEIAGAPGMLALYVGMAVLIGATGGLALVGTRRARRDILAAQSP